MSTIADAQFTHQGNEATPRVGPPHLCHRLKTPNPRALHAATLRKPPAAAATANVERAVQRHHRRPSVSQVNTCETVFLLVTFMIVAVFSGLPLQSYAADERPVQAVAASTVTPPATNPQGLTVPLLIAPEKKPTDATAGTGMTSTPDLKKDGGKSTEASGNAGDVSKNAHKGESAFCNTNCVKCDPVGFCTSSAVVGLLSVLYLWLVVITKNRMVANPTRQNFLAKVNADIAELKNTGGTPGSIDVLKEELERVKKSVTPTLKGEFFFWSGGAELAGWNSVHAIACQRIFYLDRPDEIAVELIASEDVLRQCKDGKDTIASALADRIKVALPNLASPVSAGDLPKLKALLAQAKGYLYDIEDTYFADLSTAYNKTY